MHVGAKEKANSGGLSLIEHFQLQQHCTLYCNAIMLGIVLYAEMKLLWVSRLAGNDSQFSYRWFFIYMHKNSRILTTHFHH